MFYALIYNYSTFTFVLQYYPSNFDANSCNVLVVVSILLHIGYKKNTLILLCSWLCCYMAQMNPLIGPRLDKHTILIMANEWVRHNLHLNMVCVIMYISF